MSRKLGLVGRICAWVALALVAACAPEAGREQSAVILPDNVGDLKLIGKIALKGPSRGIPVFDGRSVFVTDTSGHLYRFDAKTGATLWQIAVADSAGVPGAVPTKSVAVTDHAVIFGLRNTPVVVALDKDSGALFWKTKVDNHPGAVITQTPAVAGGKVFIGVSGLGEEVAATTPPYVCCSFRGSMLALDAGTGAILWKTYTVPSGFSGGSVWSGAPLVDARRHSVYFTTGNAFRAPAEVQACLDRSLGDRNGLSACYPPGVWTDSILALDPDTGGIKWGFRADDYDVFTGACLVKIGGFCGGGDDYDFGNGALLWRTGGRDLVGAGQKSGEFWALDPDTGLRVWRASAGPGGPNGGIEYGSAADGASVYVAEGDTKQVEHDPAPYTLPSGQTINFGSYAALDAGTGKIVWQVPDPAGAHNPDNGQRCTVKGPKENCVGAYAKGAVSVANGVVFACSTAPQGPMYAFDGRTGRKLWEYDAGVSCDTKATVAGGIVYWVAGPNILVFSASPQPALLAAKTTTAGRSVHDGVYAAFQAERGKALYRQNCATACHNENLSGAGPSPSLAGPDFRGRWSGVSVGALYMKIRTTMPKASPGSLADEDYLAIVAYLLAANEFPPGTDDLPKDQTALGRIAISK